MIDLPIVHTRIEALLESVSGLGLWKLEWKVLHYPTTVARHVSQLPHRMIAVLDFQRLKHHAPVARESETLRRADKVATEHP